MSSVNHILASLERSLANLPVADRALTDLRALRYHLDQARAGQKPVVVVLGGTGTGKSTVVNRMLGREISASSFRRTYTSGLVAVSQDDLDPAWSDMPHQKVDVSTWPVRGVAEKLLVTQFNAPVVQGRVLVDTPDLDGDTPANHALADRAFRWADVVVFLVSPEKYQMNELQPYYRLTSRYEVPAIYVMNKCESDEQLSDYRAMLPKDSVLFAIARDDSAYSSPDGVEKLKTQIENQKLYASPSGLRNRRDDLVNRLVDQVIGPMEKSRKEVDARTESLGSMVASRTDIDVNPITQNLRRRMRERSVLYLVGPQRVLDRVRQLPGLLARLPRTTWDLVTSGKIPEPVAADEKRAVPDFRAMAVDQFRIIQSRIEEIASPASIRHSLLDPDEAGRIVDDELNQLQKWLSERWDKTPRDTAIINRFLKIFPGAEKLTKLSETAPYLLTIIVATHHVMFGHVDLAILGTWSLVTWLGEKMSNEVSARTKQANRNIADRFEQLARSQISRICSDLNASAPNMEQIEAIQSLTEQLADAEVLP